MVFIALALAALQSPGGFGDLAIETRCGSAASGAAVVVIKDSNIFGVESETWECLFEAASKWGTSYEADNAGVVSIPLLTERSSIVVTWNNQAAVIQSIDDLPARVILREGSILAIRVCTTGEANWEDLGVFLATGSDRELGDRVYSSMVRLNPFGVGIQVFPFHSSQADEALFAFVPGVWAGVTPTIELGNLSQSCLHGTLRVPSWANVIIAPEGGTSIIRYWENDMDLVLEDETRHSFRVWWSGATAIGLVEEGIPFRVELFDDVGDVLAKVYVDEEWSSPEDSGGDFEVGLDAASIACQLDVNLSGIEKILESGDSSARMHVIGVGPSVRAVDLTVPRIGFVFSNSPHASNGGVSTKIKLDFVTEKIAGTLPSHPVTFGLHNLSVPMIAY